MENLEGTTDTTDPRFDVMPLSLSNVQQSRKMKKRIRILLFVLSVACVILWFARNTLFSRSLFGSSDNDFVPLFVLPQTVSDKTGAFCLDGSPPGYYLKPGVDYTKWIIHFPGGDWCTTAEECLRTSLSNYGSSDRASQKVTFDGILSSNPFRNPTFYSWTKVKMLYCDGGSFLGNNSVNFNQKRLYMRGEAIMDAVLGYLYEKTKFALATDLLLTGSSAGGVALQFYADYLHQKLKHISSIHVILDGMLFINQSDKQGVNTMDKTFTNLVDIHHAYDSPGMSRCIKWHGRASHYCFFPDAFYFHLFMKSATFFVSSLHDTWYLRDALGVSCSYGSCPARDIDVIQRHSKMLLHLAETIMMLPAKNGIYITACPMHTVLQGPLYNRLVVDGVTPQKAISEWYTRQTKVKYIEKELVPGDEQKCP